MPADGLTLPGGGLNRPAGEGLRRPSLSMPDIFVPLEVTEKPFDPVDSFRRCPLTPTIGAGERALSAWGFLGRVLESGHCRPSALVGYVSDQHFRRGRGAVVPPPPLRVGTDRAWLEGLIELN